MSTSSSLPPSRAHVPGNNSRPPTLFRRISRKLSLSGTKVLTPRTVVLRSTRQVEDFTARLRANESLDAYNIHVHLPKQECKRKQMELAVQTMYLRDALVKGTLKPAHSLRMHV
ncbi:hypothetical protein HDZ31DRAFT_30474 [Schizophyllum fasciatum]